MGLVVVAIVAAPPPFFRALPDPLQTSTDFEALTELIPTALLGALRLLAPRGAAWVAGLVLGHAALAIWIDGVVARGPALSLGWIAAREASKRNRT